ncbi:MAG TPA: hypothetical protein VK631_22150 [Solirubrobacteraceae bacterium]|nr:hypothetical protein [Solirubrobacteraceae bacterium]
MPAQNKPPGARTRRNKGQADWKPVEGKRAPAWPGAKDDPPEAKRYWSTVWSELGGMWAAADKMPLYRAAMLHAAVVASAQRKGLVKTLKRIADNDELEEGDREFLLKLSVDFAFGGADAAAAKELRELEDRLGISPASRRRLQWELQQGTGKSDPETAAPATDAARTRRTSSGTVLAALA